MILQLNPPIPIITPKGKALAHALIDSGIENELQWVCFQDSTGECWTWHNPDVRARKNITHGRDHISPFYNPKLVALKKKGGWFCEDCNGHNECDCDEEEEDDAYEELHEEYMKLKNKIEESERNRIKSLSLIKSKDEEIKKTKTIIMDLQDMLLQLLRHERINQLDIVDVVNLLKTTGVEDCDIKIIGNQIRS